jgi:hypothetical protein
MLFKIPEQYISLFRSNRPVTKPAPAEVSRVTSSRVEPPNSEMARMSLQEKPPVHKTGTSGKQ